MSQNESSDNSTSLLKEQVAALERQVFSMLLLLIVISGTVTVYLYREASQLGKEIQAVTPQASRLVQAVNDNRPVMTAFLNSLAEYGKTHPDFEQQIMIHNGLVPPPGGIPA